MDIGQDTQLIQIQIQLDKINAYKMQVLEFGYNEEANWTFGILKNRVLSLFEGGVG